MRRPVKFGATCGAVGVWVNWLACDKLQSQSKVEDHECNSDSYPSP